MENVLKMSRRMRFGLAVAGFVLMALLGGAWAQARGLTPESATPTLSVAELPPQAARTYDLIRRGGPFEHEKDGVVFGNRERLLPLQKRGYYREYTVPTPGSRSRGTRRIVCGGPARAPDVCYYTGDHYASFGRIMP